MNLKAQADRWSNYDAFQTAFSEYREAGTLFEARVLALINSEAEFDDGLDALAQDLEEKHRRYMELAKPFIHGM